MSPKVSRAPSTRWCRLSLNFASGHTSGPGQPAGSCFFPVPEFADWKMERCQISNSPSSAIFDGKPVPRGAYWRLLPCVRSVHLGPLVGAGENRDSPYRCCLEGWNPQGSHDYGLVGGGAQTLTPEWSPQRRETDKLIRCPYCVEEETFKAMFRHHGGDWFVCGVCGHLSLPSDPFFECTCRKCIALRTMQANLNARSTARRH
jgi:hypothetical protein